jgi:outer membrane protein assembly factor BamB
VKRSLRALQPWQADLPTARREPRQVLSICTTLVCTLALVAAAPAADWPNWRGPNYDGISPETGFQSTWKSPPPIVWEQKLGSAFSAITCVDGKAYTCGTQEKQQVVFCLDADTGKILWQKPIEPEYRERQGGDGTRATPTIHEGRAYVLGALGRLLCCDAASGEEVWSKQFESKPQWGYAGSVLIEGDLAIVTAGGDDGPLAALDKRTGQPVWKCGADPVGYATPYAFTFEGQRYMAGLLGKSVIIADAKTGRQVWSMPWVTDYDVNAATPIFHDGCLLLSSGYKHGAILVKLTRDGDKLTSQTVWESKVIQAKFQTPVLYQDYLYDSGDHGLNCVEFMTGKEMWKKPDVQNSAVLLADGQLIVLTEKGQLQIGRAAPVGFEPTTDVEILKGRCWTIPTLYRGRLYLRNLEQMRCLKLTP